MNSFIETVKEDCMYEISKYQFYRTRAKYAAIVMGLVEEQYKSLWDYGKELKKTNPGSTVQVEGTRGVFKRMYVCLGACKEGFKASCKPVIGLDGCFLKTTHGGQLLVAVGIDSENCMFPVAWAVMDAENRANWTWFIELLVVDIEMYNSRALTFISNKQKGLAATKSTTVPKWNAVMNEMKTVNEEAFCWFKEKPTVQWTRSHFQEHTKCDILLNNLCEVFNASIVVAREKLIITMLDKIRHQQMTRMVAKREAAQRKWQPSGIPCAHAVSGTLSKRIDIDEFVDEYYKKERYLMAYNPVIQPMSGPELWPELGKHPLKPPVKKKQAGRPKKLRKRSQTELPTGVKMSRTGM
ncbi:uncharacterized protein LOC111382776 [Olea europaea var. sylvestris]|uniref:uncharacterized protein LOC111382776 n=1 Tax=Olea europaea var. sylvestris TaxID=158386 RepID=UPI000C1D3239|nr:uncharacterized protein LOC111382776 [Olea europaea var. sylvestris]